MIKKNIQLWFNWKRTRPIDEWESPIDEWESPIDLN